MNSLQGSTGRELVKFLFVFSLQIQGMYHQKNLHQTEGIIDQILRTLLQLLAYRLRLLLQFEPRRYLF